MVGLKKQGRVAKSLTKSAWNMFVTTFSSWLARSPFNCSIVKLIRKTLTGRKRDRPIYSGCTLIDMLEARIDACLHNALSRWLYTTEKVGRSFHRIGNSHDEISYNYRNAAIKVITHVSCCCTINWTRHVYYGNWKQLTWKCTLDHNKIAR